MLIVSHSDDYCNLSAFNYMKDIWDDVYTCVYSEQDVIIFDIFISGIIEMLSFFI